MRLESMKLPKAAELVKVIIKLDTFRGESDGWGTCLRADTHRQAGLKRC